MRRPDAKPRPAMPTRYQRAEAEFLETAANNPPKAVRKNTSRMNPAVVEALKRSNADYFALILDDETEGQLWRLFMTGKQMRRDPEGNPMTEEIELNGKTYLVPIVDDVELNPICLKAFLRAVEYKRGQPVAIEEKSGEGFKVVFETQGAAPEFFQDQGKATGLIR